jgi:hypothetical protein
MRTLLRRAILAAVPAVTLPAALLAAPGPAQAFPTPVTLSIAHQATLEAQFGAVLTVIYRCPAPAGNGVMFVSVEQGTNTGNTMIDVTCAGPGTKIALPVFVPAGPAGPYVPGDATASVIFDPGAFNQVTAQTTVKLK